MGGLAQTELTERNRRPVPSPKTEADIVAGLSVPSSLVRKGPLLSVLSALCFVSTASPWLAVLLRCARCGCAGVLRLMMARCLAVLAAAPRLHACVLGFWLDARIKPPDLACRRSAKRKSNFNSSASVFPAVCFAFRFCLAGFAFTRKSKGYLLQLSWTYGFGYFLLFFALGPGVGLCKERSWTAPQ